MTDLAAAEWTLSDVLLAARDHGGTPVRLVDLDGIDRSYRQFCEAWRERLPAVRVAYSFKTNPLGAVTRHLREAGAMAEVVSGMELSWALADGYARSDVVFNGPVKHPAELERAIEHDAIVNADRPGEIDAVSAAAGPERPARVGVRVDTGDVAGEWTRFGMDRERAAAALRAADDTAHLRPVAVHQHLGTNVSSPETYERACRDLRPVVEQLFQLCDPERCFVNVGGGFPVASTQPVDAAEWDPPGVDRFGDAVAAGLGPLSDAGATILAEPGRALVEPHGHLVCEVLRRTRVDGRPALLIDGGSNLVPSIADFARPVSFASADGDPLVGSETVEYDLYGPLCLQSDRLGEGVPGPRDVEPGDHVVVHGVGGYDVPGAYPWIRPRPAVLAHLDGRIEPIRVPDTPESIRARERAPFAGE